MSIERAIVRYQRGENILSIAYDEQVSISHLYKNLKRAHIPRQRRLTITEAARRTAVKLVMRGQRSVLQVALSLNVTKRTVRYWMRTYRPSTPLPRPERKWGTLRVRFCPNCSRYLRTTGDSFGRHWNACDGSLLPVLTDSIGRILPAPKGYLSAVVTKPLPSPIHAPNRETEHT